MVPTPLLWPVQGILRFCATPRWWLRPLVGSFLGVLTVMALGLGTAWWAWPTSEESATLGFFGWLWAFAGVAAWTSASLLCGWLFVVPLWNGWAYEQLIRQVLQQEGHTLPDIGVARSLRETASMMLRSLPLRLGWLCVGLATGALGWAVPIFAPLAMVAAMLASGQVMLFDACDLALASQGAPPKERMQHLKLRSWPFFTAGAVAGAAGHVMALTVIGWLWWAPGLHAAAAIITPNWKQPPHE